MKSKQLVLELLKREGKKKQVNAAQMKEIVGCLADILFKRYQKGFFDMFGIIKNLLELGRKRAEKKKKKKK